VAGLLQEPWGLEKLSNLSEKADTNGKSSVTLTGDFPIFVFWNILVLCLRFIEKSELRCRFQLIRRLDGAYFKRPLEPCSGSSKEAPFSQCLRVKAERPFASARSTAGGSYARAHFGALRHGDLQSVS
jgi:hypothetical protein